MGEIWEWVITEEQDRAEGKWNIEKCSVPDNQFVQKARSQKQIFSSYLQHVFSAARKKGYFFGYVRNNNNTLWSFAVQASSFPRLDKPDGYKPMHVELKRLQLTQHVSFCSLLDELKLSPTRIGFFSQYFGFKMLLFVCFFPWFWILCLRKKITHVKVKNSKN